MSDSYKIYASKDYVDSEIGQLSEDVANLSVGISPIAPRALIRQMKPYMDEDNALVYFEDVYAFHDTRTTAISNRCTVMYALEAHKVAGTTQRIFKSLDGEKWNVLASLNIDAANGQWYTDIFVDAINAYNATAKETIYLIKTTDGFNQKNNQLCTAIWNGSEWYASSKIELGVMKWLGNNNSIDVCSSADWSKRTVIFGEYATTTDGSAYKLWRSTNGGITWTNVLEIGGDFDGITGNGDIRHWHTVAADPWTKHWWATSGDAGGQCRIYRSTDDGETWVLMFSGTQRERTCGFVFEQDFIYYGMDSTVKNDVNYTKIIRIDKSKLETEADRATAREDVAIVDSAFAVYGLTRTICPDGFIVWSQQEPGASDTPGRYILQFYDYATSRLYPIAYFDTSGIDNSKYIGFYAGARAQNAINGTVIARPTRSLQQERYSDSYVSTHIKINLTM